MYKVLAAVMGAFALAGALDRILGNRLGLGEKFEEGILAMGQLALAMIGIICLAPVLARVLRPAVVPVYRLLGADPAMFAGTILACDMGAGPLAAELAESPEAALLGGVITGSMLGATVVFTIPVAMGILEPEDRPALAKGILCGVVTIPLGVLVGGLVSGFGFGMTAGNLGPIVLIAGLLALGLKTAQDQMIRGFEIFGRLVTALITVGLGAAVWQELTGIVLIPGMAPIQDGFLTAGAIAAVLAGAFPMVAVLTRVLAGPLACLGRKLGIGEKAAAGMLACLANSIAAYGLVRQMDSRGKVVCIAFSVSAAFVFGDHLGFAAGFAPRALPGMIAGKLAGGISAAALAIALTDREEKPFGC